MAFPEARTRFDEIFDFLASGPTTMQIIEYQPSETLKARLSTLLERNRSDEITPDEREELEEYLRIDRFISRIKRHARKSSGAI